MHALSHDAMHRVSPRKKTHVQVEVKREWRPIRGWHNPVDQVDRIDHGVNALDDERLMKNLAKTGMGLTICPISNRFVVQNLTGREIRAFLKAGIKATINSDDPAYFRGYMNENLQALADDANFTQKELAQLTRNAFDVCWAEPKLKARMQDQLASYLAKTM